MYMLYVIISKNAIVIISAMDIFPYLCCKFPLLHIDVYLMMCFNFSMTLLVPVTLSSVSLATSPRSALRASSSSSHRRVLQPA